MSYAIQPEEQLYLFPSEANCSSFEQCMHKVSRVETKDISLLDVRLGRLLSCLEC